MKTVRYLLFPCFLLLIGSFVPMASAELAYEPARSCPVQVIRKDQIKSIIERRQTTFKHCLSCSGDQCELRQWPEEGKDFAQACRLLFCTPTKMPGKMFMPDEVEEGGVFFTYGISAKGRIKDVQITDFMGISEKDARQLINNYFERRRYEPIVIDGKSYELVNLKDGTNFTINWKLNVR